MFSYQAPTIRTDATPTEAQMKLAIAQTLSDPSFYNAPVIVLDFETDDTGRITGKFKDAVRPRVFSFEVNGKSVNYKPFSPGRMDSVEDIEEWEQFSEGYSYRVDAKAKATGKKAQCTKGYNCGSICISPNKECQKEPGNAISEQRIKLLTEGAKAYNEAAKKAGSSDPLESTEEQMDLRSKALKAETKAKEIKSRAKKASKKQQISVV